VGWEALGTQSPSSPESSSIQGTLRRLWLIHREGNKFVSCCPKQSKHQLSITGVPLPAVWATKASSAPPSPSRKMLAFSFFPASQMQAHMGISGALPPAAKGCCRSVHPLTLPHATCSQLPRSEWGLRCRSPPTAPGSDVALPPPARPMGWSECCRGLVRQPSKKGWGCSSCP